MDDELFTAIVYVIRDWKASNPKGYLRIEWTSLVNLETLMHQEIERRNKIGRVEKKLDKE